MSVTPGRAIFQPGLAEVSRCHETDFAGLESWLAAARVGSEPLEPGTARPAAALREGGPGC